jgi:hypothetical protein
VKIQSWIGTGAFAMLVGMSQGSVQSFAQTASPPALASPHLVTRVLAVGKLTDKATSDDLPSVLNREVPATLKLYLAGKIDAWYAKPDLTGVVFILNVTTVDEARALLDPLPLGQAGMMTFELTPLGPLQPLGLLLRPPAK